MPKAKVSNYELLKEAYSRIEDADQKVGNLAVYTTDDVNNRMFSMPNRQVALGRAIHLGRAMIENDAPEEELIRFFRYYKTIMSKVSLHLDYKKAEKENDIKTLRAKYKAGFIISK